MSGSNRRNDAARETKASGAAKDIYMIRFVGLCICLAVGMIGQPAAAQPGDSVSQPRALPQVLDNPVAAVRFEQLSATREKPLFAPDRHLPVKPPIVMPPAPPPPPPAAPPQVSLLGVVIDGNGPRAVIRSDPSGKNIPLRLGDDVAGWRVTEIEDQQLVLSLDDRSFAVKLFGREQPVPAVHARERVLEVNAAGILRSHRVRHTH